MPAGFAAVIEQSLTAFNVVPEYSIFKRPLPFGVPLSALAVGSAEKINQMLAGQMDKFAFGMDT